ncbi:MAG: hypothetical protein RQ741_01985 [Wenzhouxiangellaceae bacterium]|nr:hypothetical protein [Wenzhouxiangellaceae bacterium]
MKSNANRCGIFVASVLFTCALSTQIFAQQAAVSPDPAVIAPLAPESLLLDIVPYNDRLIAVGERGHVLINHQDREWRQASPVPVQSTLTRITTFGRRLWSVGHDSAIISSMDGGDSWFLQHFEPSAEEPLLDVLFINPNRGFAIGAYGRFMSTGDGGSTWQTERIADRVTSESIDWDALGQLRGDIETIPDDVELEADDDELLLDKGCYEFQECHLNKLLRLDDGRMMIAAERGYGYRSVDDGESWDAFAFPYTGSMFGLVEQGECIIAFGLRGHIQKSCDFGDSWRQFQTEGEQGLMGGMILPNGNALLVGNGATRIELTPDNEMERQYDRLGSDYAAVALDQQGNQVLVGEDGIIYE